MDPETASRRRAAALEVTVVVSTYERAELLPGLVRHLEEQTLPRERFEVIVVDNGSRDGTSAVLKQLATSTSVTLRTGRLEVNRGPAGGRNLGIELARGDVIAFTDDDCRPQPGWLAAGLSAMDQGARVAVGRVEPASGRSDGPFSRTVRVTDARFFHTANVFYRRQDLQTVGGFDQAFTHPGGEDTDLALRVLAHGGEAVFVHDALMQHPVSPSSFRAALDLASRWIDIPLFFRRHPAARATLAYRRWFWKRSHLYVCWLIAGAVAAAVWWPLACLGLPYAWFRLRLAPVIAARSERLLSLPGVLIIDLIEVVTMLRGSVRHRTLLL